MTKDLGLYPAINEIGRARQANDDIGVNCLYTLFMRAAKPEISRGMYHIARLQE